MFSFCKKGSKGIATVGWTVEPLSGGTIWYAPEAVERDTIKTPSPKAVTKCPAVLDFEARYYVVRCPFDIHVKLRLTDKGPQLDFPEGNMGAMSPDAFKRMTTFSPPDQWRHPRRPVMQVATPYRFVTDDPVYISQVPAFLHYHPFYSPGVLISGRFPLDVWPRALMWAFEWHDLDKPLIFKRGEPWFMAYFETDNPDKKIKMVEAQRTDEYLEYCNLIDSVTPKVNQTFSLFKLGWKRRPKQLLVPKEK
jgi:hypothetical protein